MTDYTDIPVAFGAISAVIALTTTYASWVLWQEITIEWTLAMVGLAAFFSGTLSALYAKT
ncbi:hypothetical protein GKQ38_00040 [Candidatus Nanohaloarchaea archaeon]|nr:hypothetical protein GKQ38_00040 [Candidatus Nanohaloarchaea archaeon]